jgi:hypothetical protein
MPTSIWALQQKQCGKKSMLIVGNVVARLFPQFLFDRRSGYIGWCSNFEEISEAALPHPKIKLFLAILKFQLTRRR